MTSRHATITDARGRTLAAVPRGRVVSLVPSLTEAVCELGAAERLVGRTIYCVEPRAMLAAVPALGGTKNPDLDAITESAPDLVLACVEENKPEHLAVLEQAGAPVFAVMPRALDDVAALLTDLGALLDVRAAAAQAVADLAESRRTATAWRTRLGAPRRAACLIWKKPWMAAGGRNHITAMMAETGLDNVLKERGGYVTVEPDELAALRPEVLLLPDEPYPFSAGDAAALVAAGAVADAGRAIRLDGKLVCWYGTRTARALGELVRVLDSRLFSEPGSI